MANFFLSILYQYFVFMDLHYPGTQLERAGSSLKFAKLNTNPCRMVVCIKTPNPEIRIRGMIIIETDQLEWIDAGILSDSGFED